MERFSYPTIAAARAESSEMLYLLECESYGSKKDQIEEMEEQLADAEARAAEAENQMAQYQ